MRNVDGVGRRERFAVWKDHPSYSMQDRLEGDKASWKLPQ